jgi:hypothetical protein
MITAEGRTVLCAGCPNTGNFVGGITEKTEAEVETVGTSLISSGETILTFKDEYGMSTAPVKIKRSRGEHEDTNEIKVILKDTVTDRVKLCVGYTASFTYYGQGQQEERTCPAYNPEVIQELLSRDEESETGE